MDTEKESGGFVKSPNQRASWPLARKEERGWVWAGWHPRTLNPDRGNFSQPSLPHALSVGFAG